MPTTVAFQGELGAYSHLAADAFLGADARVIPCKSFDDVFEKVSRGSAERAVVPVENSLAGTIHRVYDLLLRHQLYIVGEHSEAIAHALIAHPGVGIGDLSVVRSHPQALAQCEHRLRDMHLHAEVAYDTAGSVKELAQSTSDVATDAPSIDPATSGALASPFAAKIYGMQILREKMQDHPDNFTRFIVLSREPCEQPAPGPTKVSIAFSLKNTPGALFKALAVFALRDLDLSKLESRPIAKQTWNYIFYLDFITHDYQGTGKRALAHLEEIAPMLRVFGAFARRPALP